MAWHLFIWSKLPSNPNIDVNPITDVAHVRIGSASELGFMDPRAVAAFNGAKPLPAVRSSPQCRHIGL